jgi:hypothetical protein
MLLIYANFRKYEEICPLQVEELCYVTDYSYTKEEVHVSAHSFLFLIIS